MAELIGQFTMRRLAPAPDLAAGLVALAGVLESLPVDRPGVHRVEVPLARPARALALPAGLPDGRLDPQMLMGPTWSGLGATVDLEVATPRELPSPDAPLRLAFSLRFDPAREPAPEWRDFGRCRLWLPTVELDSARNVLALNWRGGLDRTALHAALTAWRPRRPAAAAARAIAWRTNGPTRAAWDRAVAAALARIADTDQLPLLRKIVLASRIDGTLARAAHPSDLLAAADLGTVGWPWWLGRGGRHWLGETPELLCAHDQGTLRTVALAGTRPRDPDPERDLALGDELLASDKDRREQAAVADWLRSRLTQLAGREPDVGPLQLRRLPSLQHLSRDLVVEEADRLPLAAWLEALHPTPALCGAPRAEVRAWLREAETFDRGLFGGVVGWLEPDRARAQVAIRGLMLHDRGWSRTPAPAWCAAAIRCSKWAEIGAKLAAVCRRLGLPSPEVSA
ncbi:MAG: chorismate-binding protein [Candidatus Krumholzibacteriia bacterium]